MGRPRYVEGPVVHPYCGRTCANLAKSNGVANMNPPVPINPVNSASPFMNYPTQPIIPANITGYQGFPAVNNTTNATGFGNPHPDPTTMQNNINNMPPSYWAPPPPPSCKTPGCFSPVSVKPNGIAGKYCTSHERWVPYPTIASDRHMLNRAQLGYTWLHILSESSNERFNRLLPLLLQQRCSFCADDRRGSYEPREVQEWSVNRGSS